MYFKNPFRYTGIKNNVSINKRIKEYRNLRKAEDKLQKVYYYGNNNIALSRNNSSTVRSNDFWLDYLQNETSTLNEVTDQIFSGHPLFLIFTVELFLFSLIIFSEKNVQGLC